MNKKDLVGDLFNQLRLRRQRSMARTPNVFTKEDAELEDTLGQMLMVQDQLDSLIGALQFAHAGHGNLLLCCMLSLAGCASAACCGKHVSQSMPKTAVAEPLMPHSNRFSVLS